MVKSKKRSSSVKSRRPKKTKVIKQKKPAQKRKVVIEVKNKVSRKPKKVAKNRIVAKAKKTKKRLPVVFSVGGLAFSHGIMMRTHDNMAVALQDAVGDVEVIPIKIKNLRKKYSFLFWPFIRGIFYLIENVYFSLGILWHKGYFIKRKLKEKTLVQRFFIALERSLRYLVYFILLVGFFDFVANRISLCPIANCNGTVFIYSILANLFYILLFVALFVLVSVTKRAGAESLYYHSAEHQIINAYEKFGYRRDILTKAINSSRIHDRCGVSVFFWATVILAFLINIFKVVDAPGLTVLAVSLGLVLISFSLSYEIISLTNRSGNSLLSYVFVKPLYAVQYLLFRNPKKRHLAAGLYALREAISTIK